MRKPAAGDYEDTLATVCYGMAPALLVAGTMYAGVVGTHDLPPPKALAVVALTVAVWLIVAGVVSVGLSTA